MYEFRPKALIVENNPRMNLGFLGFVENNSKCRLVFTQVESFFYHSTEATALAERSEGQYYISTEFEYDGVVSDGTQGKCYRTSGASLVEENFDDGDIFYVASLKLYYMKLTISSQIRYFCLNRFIEVDSIIASGDTDDINTFISSNPIGTTFIVRDITDSYTDFAVMCVNSLSKGVGGSWRSLECGVLAPFTVCKVKSNGNYYVHGKKLSSSVRWHLLSDSVDFSYRPFVLRNTLFDKSMSFSLTVCDGSFTDSPLTAFLNSSSGKFVGRIGMFTSGDYRYHLLMDVSPDETTPVAHKVLIHDVFFTVSGGSSYGVHIPTIFGVPTGSPLVPTLWFKQGESNGSAIHADNNIVASNAISLINEDPLIQLNFLLDEEKRVILGDIVTEDDSPKEFMNLRINISAEAESVGEDILAEGETNIVPYEDYIVNPFDSYTQTLIESPQLPLTVAVIHENVTVERGKFYMFLEFLELNYVEGLGGYSTGAYSMNAFSTTISSEDHSLLSDDVILIEGFAFTPENQDYFSSMFLFN